MVITKSARCERPAILTSRKMLDFILTHGSLQKVMQCHRGKEYECYLFEAKDQDLKIWVSAEGISDIVGEIYRNVRNHY